MARARPVLRDRYGVLAANVAARLVALGALSLATLVVARSGGPAAVGAYALLRVLPSLVGVVCSAGLPGAIAYFLAGPARSDRRAPPTLLAMAVAGGVAGAALWLAATPLLTRALFAEVPAALVATAAVAVATRVLAATAKSCSQGSGDLPGANRVIVTEELSFLPAYALVWLAGARGYGAVVGGLVLADLATIALAWSRLVRRGFFQGAARPSRALARRIAGYGMRAQVGGVITLLNLRLDFVLMSVLTSSAVLGVYAVASKYAELVRVLSVALGYVLYPRFASDGPAAAAERARSLLPRAGLLTAAAVLPLWVAAGSIVPGIYGSSFDGAVLPARIILLGLVLDGIGGVIIGYLYGVGRPGLSSAAVAVGLVATLLFDLLLIPRYAATGGAIASACAYSISTLALVGFFVRLTRSSRPGGGDLALSRAEAPLSRGPAEIR